MARKPYTSRMSRKILDQRIRLPRGTAHLLIWELDGESLPPSAPHRYKYRLAYLEGERVRVLYDVHTGKSDHKHIDGIEHAYTFSTTKRLVDDFFSDIGGLQQ